MSALIDTVSEKLIILSLLNVRFLVSITLGNWVPHHSTFKCILKRKNTLIGIGSPSFCLTGHLAFSKEVTIPLVFEYILGGVLLVNFSLR